MFSLCQTDIRQSYYLIYVNKKIVSRICYFNNLKIVNYLYVFLQLFYITKFKLFYVKPSVDTYLGALLFIFEDKISHVL